MIKINGFKVYYCNHPDGTSHGGAAVIIKECIKQHALLNFQHPHLQAIAVAIDDWQGALTVAAVYCPPRHRMDEQMFTDFFCKLGKRFITGGDWNAKNTYWGSRLITTRGRELKKAIDKFSLVVHSTGEPTYWPTDTNKTPDLIDFFISKGMSELYTRMESCLDGTSDHTPIICTVSTTIIWKEAPNTLYNRKTDWEAFREYIDVNINLSIRLKTEEDIESATLYATNLIQKAAWLSTPFLSSKRTPQDISVKIKEKIAKKRRLRRKWQTSRNHRYKRELNKEQKELKQMLGENENQTLQDKLQTLSPHQADDYSLWKITKSLKRPKDHVPPLRKPNGEWSRQPSEKAELFANFLKKVFTPNDPDLIDTEREIDHILTTDKQELQPVKRITPAEVKRSILE